MIDVHKHVYGQHFEMCNNDCTLLRPNILKIDTKHVYAFTCSDYQSILVIIMVPFQFPLKIITMFILISKYVPSVIPARFGFVLFVVYVG